MLAQGGRRLAKFLWPWVPHQRSCAKVLDRVKKGSILTCHSKWCSSSTASSHDDVGAGVPYEHTLKVSQQIWHKA